MEEQGFPPKKARGWPKGKPRKQVLTPLAKAAENKMFESFPGQVAPEAPKKSGWQMKAPPNWDSQDLVSDGNPDRLHIPRELFPDGMDMQWVMRSVYGQEMPSQYNIYTRGGWTLVHPQDGDGRFDGMFMPKGYTGHIEVDGLVLMMRPMHLSLAAKRRELADAREQIMIKERALRSGDIGVKGADHESALRTNRIVHSVEQVSIPRGENKE